MSEKSPCSITISSSTGGFSTCVGGIAPSFALAFLFRMSKVSSSSSLAPLVDFSKLNLVYLGRIPADDIRYKAILNSGLKKTTPWTGELYNKEISQTSKLHHR